MIRNRPSSHQALPYYGALPPLPYQIRLDRIPELVKLSLFPLRHVEPLTSETINLNEAVVEDNPNDSEWQFYESNKSEFQLLFLVISSVFAGILDGVAQLHPYSVSLVPASKRNQVEVCRTPFVKAMCGTPVFEEGAAYSGLDPFSGEWSIFSEVGLIASLGSKNAFTDELGLVYDYFFLRLNLDQRDVAQPGLDMPEDRLGRYLKHRSKLLYTPFDKVESRQVWGVKNALELFVLQEIIHRSLPSPVPQAMIFNDGSWQPTLYHAWYEFAGSPTDLVSEVDFLFPEKKVAVFCDGATHRRARIKARDQKIDLVLNELGFKPVRIGSRAILQDVIMCVNEIQAALS